MSFDNSVRNEKIEIVSHREEWFNKFISEKRILSEALKGHFQHIEHIGSTTVNGLDAKPIIDIAILTENVSKVPMIHELLSKLQYSYHGEYGLPGRHFFIKGKPREFDLHIVDGNTNHWEQWIAFREILKRDREICRRYQDLKYRLLERYQFDREKFTKGKADFIKTILNEQFKKS